MMDESDHGSKIMSITHAIICGLSLEEAEQAFSMLCTVDLEAATHLADIMVLASPDSAPIWKSIIDHMAKEHPRTYNEWASTQSKMTDDRESGPAMSADDTLDTAGNLADHMGWLDVETRGKP